MSWDVMVLRSENLPPDLGNPPEDWMPDEMGEAELVRSKISQALPGVDWSDPAWGRFEGEGFSIEFNFQESGAVNAFTLHIRGWGDPLPAIVGLCRPHGWAAFDYSDGSRINLDNPSRENWAAFQAYRDKVTGQR